MKIIIVGAGGQVGRALLHSAPDEFEVIGRDSAQLDVSNRQAVFDAVQSNRPDAIINAAAYTAVDRAEQDEERALAINGTGVENLAHAAATIGARLIHISTDFVFDGASREPYCPADPASPINAYGRTKLAGEHAALAWRDALVVRTSWVYASEGNNFVNTMLRLMRTRTEVSVVCDQMGTPTWATSLASALWALTSSEATGILHFTDGGSTNWYEFARAIQDDALHCGLLEAPIEIKPIGTSSYPTPAKRPAYSVLDTTRTAAILGYRSQNWRNNLKKMIKELTTNA
ncbi:dTDP-4-dehydrorhamnose reductase [Altererythrobacter sp. Z27]|uniref:dTDP-4-dehydrorhamnose reductase n=1 Tax=Altererythrobacter sp. Z27 TaxID=3461147 RepID=UPI0040439B7E